MKMTSLRRFLMVLPAVCAMALAGVASGATVVVNQTGITFSPADITIDEGDTVQWVWSGGSHTVTEGVGGGPCVGCAFDSPLNSGTPTYSVNFDSAFLATNPRAGNVYDYYCQPHQAAGMIGSVTVVAAPIPTVSEWGLIIMGTLLLGVGALAIRRMQVRAIGAAA